VTGPDVPLSVETMPMLNQAARASSAAVDAVLSALAFALDAQARKMTLYPEGILPDLNEANDKAQRVHRLLLQAGASDPGTPSGRDIPLHLLDTPDTRELLDLLKRAQAVAERVDASRGRSLSSGFPLSPGESYGTDLAESISEIVLRVGIEVHGPAGKE
jgi:hypothetical protein